MSKPLLMYNQCNEYHSTKGLNIGGAICCIVQNGAKQRNGYRIFYVRHYRKAHDQLGRAVPLIKWKY